MWMNDARSPAGAAAVEIMGGTLIYVDVPAYAAKQIAHEKAAVRTTDNQSPARRVGRAGSGCELGVHEHLHVMAILWSRHTDMTIQLIWVIALRPTQR